MDLTSFENILWDFDGVILDSMKIRDEGFYGIFESFPLSKVEELMAFHRKNGGLSRYVKIRYFYNEILQKTITDEQVNDLASKFSKIMLKKLTNKALLIEDSLKYIKEKEQEINFHIVSGSDGKELNILCNELNIAQHFITIDGSPTPKKELVRKIMGEYNYDVKTTVLIGDSINDYEAAIHNNISFMGYNNPNLKEHGEYIDSFTDFL